MKTQFCKSKIAIVLVAALVSAWAAAAEDIKIFTDMDSAANAGTNGPYLSAGAGLSIMQNMAGTFGNIQYHVGPRADASAGYNLPRNIAVELQTGIAYNSWSAIRGASIPPGDSASVWAVPIMANGLYKYSFNKYWRAYGGLGAGVLISTFDISDPISSSTSTDCTFGYQAMLGIKCTFDEHLEWGLGYNFLGSLDHHWEDFGRGITTSPTYNHSFLVSLTYKF